MITRRVTMIEITKTEVYGWEPTIRGMRNPMNSWDRSDSDWEFVEDPSIINPNDEVKFVLGPNDADLMKRLCKGGPVHAKFRRMIVVYADINAPLYWWKEYDTYKVGTVANSCSTMHKIHAKEFTLSDFSWEHLDIAGCQMLEMIIDYLNLNRNLFIETKDTQYWHNMIQILPTSYNQLRTVELNYEVLHNIYHSRKNHKLNEWHRLCEWIEALPNSWIITGKEPEDGET
jgi:hypothetical protein